MNILNKEKEEIHRLRFQKYQRQDGTIFKRVFLMVFVPPAYNPKSLHKAMQYIKKFQKFQNHIHSDTQYGDDIIHDEDVKIYAMDCRP